MSRLDPRRRLRRRARRAAAGRVRRREGPGPVQPARVPHAAARGCSTRSAKSPRHPRRTSSKSRSRPARDAEAAEAALLAAAAAVARRDRTPMGRCAGRSPLVGLAVAAGTDVDLHRQPSCREGRAGRSARRARRRRGSSARRAPIQGADPRTRLAIASRRSQHDTAVMAYLLDPGEGKYALEDLALRYLSVELQSPDQVEGTLDLALDLDGDAGTSETGRRAAIVLQLVETLEARWRRASSTICTGGSSCRSCRCWPRWKPPASGSTSTSSRNSARSWATSAARQKRRSTRSPASSSTSTRRRSCAGSCSRSSASLR